MFGRIEAFLVGTLSYRYCLVEVLLVCACLYSIMLTLSTTIALAAVSAQISCG